MATASSLSSSSSLRGAPLVASCGQVKASSVRVVVGPCRCQIVKDESVLVQRRHALVALLTASAAFSTHISPALAVYGEAANVFGSRKKETGFVPVSKDGFEIEVPAKWNPSREAEYPGTVLRYEDNFDANSNLAVMITPTTKSSIKDYGSPEEFLNSVSYLFGRQSYAGKTKSEGGFEANAVASASVLETSAPVIKGKDYYNISVLTRTADGDEGGKHQVIVGTVSDGKLYLLKIQAGDKRWFKGAKKFVEGTANSFTVV